MQDKIEKANLYILEQKNKIHSRYRNIYHAMPPVGWMNDPNGVIYAFGKYHLFFQFHPYSAEWGPMHWGHYTSDDMIVWKDEGVALAPDMPYDDDGCFSGSSIIIDGKLYIMYTCVHQGKQEQALVVSEDGITFSKVCKVIESNQIPNTSSVVDFRDPKVFKKGNDYYCILGSKSIEGDGQLLLYKSKNLKDWEYVSPIIQDHYTKGVYECPDYFELEDKEIIFASPQWMKQQGYRNQNQHANLYSIGKLDVEDGKFIQEYTDELDSGFDFYAAQTLQAPDGRRIMIAWMAMWDRTLVTAPDGWSGAMTLPRELTLKNGKLNQNPIKEIEAYRGVHFSLEEQEIKKDILLPRLSDTKEIIAIFAIGTATRVGLKVFCGTRPHLKYQTLIYYDLEKECVVFDRFKMGTRIEHGPNENNAFTRLKDIKLENGILKLRVFIDVSSCEIFINDGECVMTGNIYSDVDAKDTYVFTEEGSARLLKLDAYSLEINKKMEEDNESF